MTESADRLLLRLVMVARRLIDVAGIEMLDTEERQVLRDVSDHLRAKYGSGTTSRSLADERGAGL